ncbi:hypothetical protein OsJ_33179 [Oryza sativa Japonica Group]|uniref:Dirigent protein n=1 Tax=Oryza sativa subsp. japonica TaxID=39947 RepID=A3C980_ORYSJ|nr:hypothetical protein OsJ_33179 [Oryza sativa Japonica Group]
MTKFKVYFHDVVGGTKPTAIRVAQAASTNGSSTFFGAVVAIDDPLTTDAASSSSEVGRAQGSYTFADQKTFGLLMNMNFVFTAGDHKGEHPRHRRPERGALGGEGDEHRRRLRQVPHGEGLRRGPHRRLRRQLRRDHRRVHRLRQGVEKRDLPAN